MEESNQKRFKPTNPREGASIFSILTFFFTWPIFFNGVKRKISIDDLYETYSAHASSTLGEKAVNAWNQELEHAKRTKATPSILKVLVKLLGWDYTLIGIAMAVEHFVSDPCKALFLGRLVQYYSSGEIHENTTYTPLYYSLGLIGMSLYNCLVTQPYFMESYHLGLKLRVICSSLIYNKTLRLSASALNSTPSGNIINLLSTDINVFTRIGISMHYLWISPLQSIVLLYLMWSEIGASPLLGFVGVAACVLIYVLLGKIVVQFRAKVSTRRDERIRLTNDLIQGINAIKMFTWEEMYARKIAQFRRTEINSTRKLLYIKGLFTFYKTIVTLSICIGITSLLLLNGTIDAKAVFVTTLVYFSICRSWIMRFPSCVTVMAESKVSLQRVLTFLLSEETHCHDTIKPKIDVAVSISNGCAKWEKNGNKNTLANITLEIKANSLTAVIGPVGSGKSSLFQVIQGELQLSNGQLHVNRPLSCASQEPWIFSASIRQNILFGNKMDKIRYWQVINCCALETDLAQFPYGDRTLVGERGASLSGGQKARISLARCIYRDANIYLLDDPLSAVDARVGKYIFENCIQTFLKGKTVILVTHQLQYLSHVNDIIALDNGIMQLRGSEDELRNSKLDLSKYLAQNEIENCDASVTVTNGVKICKQDEESKNTGFITYSTYRKYLCSSKRYCLIILSVFFCVVAELATSGSFYFTRHWAQNEHYHRTASETEEETYYIYIYCSIAMAAIVLALLRLVFFTNLAISSSKSLHNSMFESLQHATLKFFISNSSGRILNRFSMDLMSVDEVLPNMATISIVSILNIIGLLAVICVVNPLFVIPTALLFIIIYCVRKFYLSINLSILRLENIARSPLYSHIQSTVQGLPTIRAFGVQEKLIEEFNTHLDTHSSALYMSYSVSRAFGYCVDVVAFLYITFTILYYMLDKDDPSSSNIGMVLSQALQLIGLLQLGIRELTEVENCMVSVERILEYSTIERERDFESTPTVKPLPTWPSEGGIQFKNVYLRYSNDDPYVLINLSFTVKPLQKIGIVGRTGAGKSSIVAALFQLTGTEGSIVIDGIDITSIGLRDLRTNISIIPQDPVLFSGTVRDNLDPFGGSDDTTLWKALEDVELKTVVSHLASGLDSSISQDGSNLSVGQRQLLCLARAIIRQNKILILDEATANVDLETDEIIQKTIRRKFANCTVLTIAHRITTIIDCDKILVMDTGKLVEFDHPHILLEKKDGVFYNMVQHMEKASIESLIETARESYGTRTY
ncbi:hypothetical protein RI129_004309 [Pyrocoelia pectoralis]|uniref:Multidrug resistance-associated protein lethal(2)03659 n=1 Tax=Pyrocoelia pectoralis TaxID=417401 RepID=A0AAN7ZGP6_9COLE